MNGKKEHNTIHNDVNRITDFFKCCSVHCQEDNQRNEQQQTYETMGYIYYNTTTIAINVPISDCKVIEPLSDLDVKVRFA